MDEPIFKQKYQKYKLRVKLWEKDFKKKHGRVPSKYDIREASQDIRDSYKMYYKLKTSFLEETLSEVLSEDGFDMLEMSAADDDLGVSMLDQDQNQSINGGPQLPFDIASLMETPKEKVNFSNLNELPNPQALSNLTNLDDNHVIRKFEAVDELQQNQNAWGPNVSNQQPLKETKSTQEEEQRRASAAASVSLKPSLSAKLFQSTRGFAKRNPRKPLSRNSLNVGASSSNSPAISESGGELLEQLPDFETILIRKAQEYKEKEAAIAGNPLLQIDHTKDAIKTNVDEGWLLRNTDVNCLGKDQTKVESNNNANQARKSHYGLSNIDVSKLKVMESNKSRPMVEPVVTLPSTTATAPTSTSTPIPPPAPAPAPAAKSRHDESSDSDSIVAESEEEAEPQEHRHLAKRRRIMPELVENQTESIPDPSPPSNKEESLKDFSVDEDEDATYEPAKKLKTKRKQATAKRQTTKPKTEKKKPKVEKKPSQPKAKKENAPKSKRKAKEKIEEILPPEEDTEMEKPLNPEDLKYVLAMEAGDITSVPRIKIQELEQADETAQRYISNITLPPLPPSAAAAAAGGGGGGGVASSSSTYRLDEKRAAARKKLEERIASGKLNENFVTINIQKKKFVRGKKSVNFSKYKKQQWRHKKRVAALSGPNMDMGGCDGGVITCFQCGGVGHFADRCKIKGDNLLPLTAQIEEDPSPFPTLAEAEQMAIQGAVAAHSRNIERLPQAANAAILQRDNEEQEQEQEEKEEGKNNNSESSDNETDDYKNLSKPEPDWSDNESDIDLDALDAAMESAKTQVTTSPIKSYVGHKIPEEFLKQAGLDVNSSKTRTQHGGISPLYDLLPNGEVQKVTPEVTEALHMFGHSNFRKGQDRAIMRTLSGLSSLVTLSTGSGKSLCYQLPAYLYSRQQGAITLVISPLVSLMEDQVTGVPHFLRAHCLHTNQTPQQRIKIQQMIAKGEIDILLVSPEAVVSGERSTGFGAILRQLPPIAFACIDEAHCVSQWSHNFRPSYLMICKVLKNNLGVRTVLGLTATATLPTRTSIIRHLGILDGEKGVISDTPLPDNLILSVSKDENRDAALLQLLNSERFEPCQSIIIYCTRRDECERVAGFIRTCIQDQRQKSIPDSGAKKKRKRVNWQAEPYHAGMPASRRRTIQNAFMGNELRIVVATIAFGMGINKPDIRAVIHYNMPRNFESYVQEIGRAGRDGLPSHCHLFLDSKGGDQNELRRHVYANSIDRHVIRKLLQKIFVPCNCEKQLGGGMTTAIASTSAQNDNENDGPRPHVCPGHEIGFSVEQTVEALDIPAENISTLLCYMELEPRWCMNVLSSAYIMAKVISYGGAKYLKHAAKECPPLAMAIALQIKDKTFQEDSNIIEFSVIDIAAGIGWNSGVVKYQLKNLEWIQVNGYPKRSPITVSFFDLGFRLKAPGDFTEIEIDNALDTLYTRSVKQEHTQLIQLQYVAHGLAAVAYNSCIHCCKADFPQDRGNQLKAIVRNYFQNDYPQDLELEIEPDNVPDDYIIGDVHALINMYPDNTFSGRNIARIFHGIPSPNYPALMWGRCKYWRAHSKVNFNRILKLANLEIVKRRT